CARRSPISPATRTCSARRVPSSRRTRSGPPSTASSRAASGSRSRSRASSCSPIYRRARPPATSSARPGGSRTWGGGSRGGRPRAEARQIRLESRIAPDLPPVLGHPELLANAAGRLIDNAIKFSKKDGGEVTLEASRTPRGLSVEVRDTGIGMPEEELGRISEMFYQIDRALHEQSGSGVGLTIVSGLVALHGGGLPLSSKPGGGCQARRGLPPASHLY